MERMIGLLRAHLMLLGRQEKAAKELEAALMSNRGDEASGLAAQIERLTNDLAKVEKAAGLYLKKKEAANWREIIDNLPPSPEKSLAEELLARIYSSLVNLKKSTLNNSVYLDRDMKFVEFNINVLTGVTAGPTYAADAAEKQSGRAVDVFRGQA